MKDGTGTIGSRFGIGPETLTRTKGDRQYISVTDVISEGPIEGLVNGTNSIFLNNDTLDDVDNSPKNLSRGQMRLTLEKGSKNGTVINSNLTSPFPTLTAPPAGVMADMYVLIRSTYAPQTVTVTNGRNPGRGDRRYIKLHTTGNTDFFTSQMITKTRSNYGRYRPNEEEKRAKPVRLIPTVTGITFNNSPIEGYIPERDNAKTAFFTGYGEYAKAIPPGTYHIEIDYYALLAVNTGGTTVKLAENWDFPLGGSNGASTDYRFDIQGLLTDAKQRVSTNYSRHHDESSVEFRTGHMGQPPIQSMLEGGTSQTFSPSGTDLELINESTLTIPANESGTGSAVVLTGLTSGNSHFNLTASKMKSIDKIKFNISYPGGLKRINSKGEDAATIAVYQVEMGFKNPGSVSFDDYILIDEELEHKGLFNNATVFQHSIDLNPFKPFEDFRIRIKRRTAESGGAYYTDRKRKKSHTNVSRSLVSQCVSVFEEKLYHPFTALGSIIFSTVNHQQIPVRTYDCKGLRIKVPSNYVTREENDSNQATYKRNTTTGNVSSIEQDWDGAFRDELVYTDNPAWIFYDMLTNNRYGLGDFLNDNDLDKYALYRIARYCDELVDDGRAGLEPRYRLNAYFTKQVDAFKVMKDLSTNFLGMLYFLDGKVFPVIDAPSGPVYSFTKGNVIDGSFNYESTGSKTRPNQVIVKWNNPANNYILEPLIVEDSVNIADTQRIISQGSVAFGCTSEGQAIRYGRWKLWTAVNQNEIVSFQTGLNGSYLAPGDVVNIQDSDRSAARFGGRVSKGGVRNTTTIPLDSPITLVSGTIASDYELSIIVNKDSAIALEDVTIGSVDYKKGDIIRQAYIDHDGNGSYTLQDIDTEEKAANAFNSSTVNSNSTAILLNWKEDFSVETRTLASNTPINTIISSLSVDTAFSVTPSSEEIWVLKGVFAGIELSGSSKAYKILSISQSSNNIYDITAAEHYNEKYSSIEDNFTTYIPNNTINAGESALANHYAGTVPQAGSVKAIPGRDKLNDLEQITLDWEHASSTANSSIKFEFLKGYEIVTDIPGYDKEPIFVSKDSDTLYKFLGVEAGSYNFAIRTVDNEGKTSSPVVISFSLAEEEYEKLALNVIAGGFVDGGFNDINSTNNLGKFTFKSRGYTFTPPQTFANEIINPESLDVLKDDFEQDCTGLPSIAWTTSDAEEATTRFIHEHHYILLDNDGTSSNAQNDYVKLIKHNTELSNVASTGIAAGLTTVPYWFDAGDGSDTLGIIKAAGLISKVDKSNIITGVNTAFTTQYKTGEIICATNNQSSTGTSIAANEVLAVYTITNIESDTKLTVSTSVGAFTSLRAATNNLTIDLKQDAVVASIYKDSADNSFKTFFYAVRSLQGVPAPFINYSNGNHGVFIQPDGTPEWLASGGTLVIKEGDTELSLNSTTQSTSYPTTFGSYNLDLTKVYGNDLTESTIIEENGVVALGPFSGSLENTTQYRITAYITGLQGKNYTLNTDITLVPITDGPLGPQGVIGPQGNVGNQGPQGDPGAKGETGPQGNVGIKGEVGPQGSQGFIGPQGNLGPHGAIGVKGDQGFIGPQGNQGETGPQGQQGPQGIVGPQGNVGPHGAVGPKGSQGIRGPQGNQGQQGPQGVQGGQGVTGPQGNVGNAGPQGNPGQAGPQGVASTVPGPVGPQGNPGQPGPQGDQGPKGVRGPQGNVGAVGPQGNLGPRGPQGSQGPKGAKGSQGNVGLTGPQGSTGNKGAKGSQGNVGLQGAQGVKGSQGAKGSQGNVGNKGAKGSTGTVGAQGAVGSAGNALAFDTGAAEKANTGSNSKMDLIRAVRGENSVIDGDVYWHIASGNVYQYSGADLTTQDQAMTHLSDATGFLRGQSIIEDAELNTGNLANNAVNSPNLATANSVVMHNFGNANLASTTYHNIAARTAGTPFWAKGIAKNHAAIGGKPILINATLSAMGFYRSSSGSTKFYTTEYRILRKTGNTSVTVHQGALHSSTPRTSNLHGANGYWNRSGKSGSSAYPNNWNTSNTEFYHYTYGLPGSLNYLDTPPNNATYEYAIQLRPVWGGDPNGANVVLTISDASMYIMEAKK